jgi:D-aminoacyl-tRNA deacylase
VLGIVVSEADHASEHVGEHLLDLADWESHEDEATPPAGGGGTVHRLHDDAGSVAVELRTFADLHVDIPDPSRPFDDPDCLVVVSRHSGDTGPLLTAHFTGNFGPATFGGQPGSFARACPNAQKAVVRAFDEHAPDDYEVGIECTHHGPTEVSVPSMFAELGSGEEEWRDPAGARSVARAVLTLRGVAPDREKQVVGFGGGHYAPRFERVVRETDWAVGHIGADWPLDEMGAPDANRDVLAGALAASAADHALLDADRPDLAAVLADLDCRVVSETFVRETDRVPLSLVASLEDGLCRVDDGLRFGERARVGSGGGGGQASADGSDTDVHADPVVVDLPADLVGEASGVDADAVRAAVADATLAFETTQHGTVVEGRAAFRAATATDDAAALVDDLAGVLARKYDAVEQVDDALLARVASFDPEKAATLGVPEGPAFGRLAAGETVEVDGREVPPSAVTTERERRFPLGDLAPPGR